MHGHYLSGTWHVCAELLPLRRKMRVSDALSNDLYDMSKTLHDLSVPLSLSNSVSNVSASKTLSYVRTASTSWLYANSNSDFISRRDRHAFAKPKREPKSKP
jgi:hypothetical protein